MMLIVFIVIMPAVYHEVFDDLVLSSICCSVVPVWLGSPRIRSVLALRSSASCFPGVVFYVGGGSLGLLASSVFFGFLAFPVAGLQKQRFAKGRNTGQQERRRKG